MDYRLIRAYCAKDLNGILKRRDKWYSTPESRFDELECQILFKHRAGARCLEPRQYAAAVCLRALELLEMPFEADDDCPEFTQADSVETSRQILADSLAAYVLHLSESESRPLLLAAELDAFTASIAKPQQTAPATDTSTPAPVVAGNEPVKQVNAMKKAALIAALEYEWRSIEADISDATRNGLKAAAHTGKHGEWDKDKARAWAVSKGKIKQSTPVRTLAGAWPKPTTRHLISG